MKRRVTSRLAPRLVPCAGLVLALALSGCGSLSRIDDGGATASPVWPELKDSTTPDGIHPDPAKLAMVKAGMTKDQLYYLLGRPHFLEGFFLVREWDYLFHLPTPSGDMACQYKILFDKDMLARQFHWREPACEAAAEAAAAKVKTGA
nr:outer membrane protein assembly factor BamE [Cupriavidus gilardii]